jgi:hypothetical protein
MALEDNANDGKCISYIDMDENCNGYIEFKYRATSMGNTTYITFRDSSDNVIISIRSYSNKLYDHCPDPNPPNTILNPISADTWYEFKIIFDSTNWRINIDGTEYGPYSFKNPIGDGISRFHIKTHTGYSGYTVYIDDFKSVKVGDC